MKVASILLASTALVASALPDKDYYAKLVEKVSKEFCETTTTTTTTTEEPTTTTTTTTEEPTTTTTTTTTEEPTTTTTTTTTEEPTTTTTTTTTEEPTTTTTTTTTEEPTTTTTTTEEPTTTTTTTTEEPTTTTTTTEEPTTTTTTTEEPTTTTTTTEEPTTTTTTTTTTAAEPTTTTTEDKKEAQKWCSSAFEYIYGKYCPTGDEPYDFCGESAPDTYGYDCQSMCGVIENYINDQKVLPPAQCTVSWFNTIQCISGLVGCGDLSQFSDELSTYEPSATPTMLVIG